MCDSPFLSFRFVVKVFKFKALFYKLRTTNYREKGTTNAGRPLGVPYEPLATSH